MADSNAGEIVYTVDMQTSALIKSTDATDKSLDRLQSSLDKTDAAAKNLGSSSRKTTNEVKPLADAIRRANEEANEGIDVFGDLWAVIGAFAGVGAVAQLIDLAEGYGEMAERITMATASTEEYEMVQKRLLATANATYRPLEEAQELYIRTADSLRSVGYSTSQALDITDSFSLALVKNAASGQRAESAIGAYSKSLQKGRIEADSWESIVSAMPSVIDDIAAASGKGSQEIRELGASGKLAAKDLNEGLRKSLDANTEAADNMAVKVSDAWQNIINNLAVYLGETNRATGATGVLSGSMQLLGDNIEAIAKTLTVVGVGALAAFIARQSVLIYNSAAASLAARKLAVDELNAARANMVAANAALAQARANALLGGSSAQVTAAVTAQTAATTRLAAAQAGAVSTSTLLLGALGGPVGLIALAAAAAAGIYLFRDSADAARPSLDELAKSVKDLSTAEADLQKMQLDKAIEELERLSSEGFKAVQQLESLTQINPTDKKFAEMLAKQRVELEHNTEKLQQYAARRKELDDYIRRPISTEPSAAPAVTTSPEGQKQLKQMREEIALLKLAGEARARLQAIQRMGETATAEERAEAEGLATQLFNLEEQHKSLEKQKQQQEKSDRDAAQGAKQNADAIADLTNEMKLASLAGIDLAQASALLKLNEYATPEQRAEVEKLTASLYAQKQALLDIALAKQLDPATGAQATFDEEMANLQRLNEAKLIEGQRYLELKTQLENSHSENMRRIEEERFAAQSRTNQLLIDSLNEVQRAGTTAITGLLTGTNSLTDAMQQLGQGIMQHAVGSLVEMGIQYVKSMIMGQSAQAAAAATAAATGAAMASAYAPAAAMASLASFGANAAPAAAGIASTVGIASGLALSGGRLHGGPVSADGMYRINENGRPEVFNAANGQQFMLPNTRGEVVSNKNASGGGSGVVNNITITVASDGSSETSTSGADPSGAESLAQGIRVVVVDELERQSRPGGSLWRMQQNG